jgi:hypothetical protein
MLARLSAAEHPRVVLVRRWFTPAVLFMAFFCVFWDGFLIRWYAIALSTKRIRWLMAVGVTNRSAAAALKLIRRATASKRAEHSVEAGSRSS